MEEYIVKVYSDSTEWFNKASRRHRLDGPALEYSDGTKEWWQKGKYHRLDGPAVEYSNGTKVWYQNGKYHRLDGPAVEWSDGTKEWWIDGREYSEEEFLKATQPATELTVAEIAKRLGINNLKIVKE